MVVGVYDVAEGSSSDAGNNCSAIVAELMSSSGSGSQVGGACFSGNNVEIQVDF